MGSQSWKEHERLFGFPHFITEKFKLREAEGFVWDEKQNQVGLWPSESSPGLCEHILLIC